MNKSEFRSRQLADGFTIHKLHFRNSAVCIVIVFLSFISLLHAQPVKRLYLANDDHTDYMWTANEAKYDSAFVKMLDFYLNEIEATKSNPSDFQARFNCDGNYYLKSYEKYRSPQQFSQLIEAIRSGHISSPLNMLVSCYGAQPTEAAIRGMYYAGQLERKYNLRFRLATSMENNTLPLGMSSLWAGSGARYSWKGIGGYASQMTYEMRATRKHQMYRYTGLDSSGVLMKWYAYNEKKNAPLGGYAECRLLIKYKNLDSEIGQVINVLDSFSSSSSYPYAVAGAFGFGHDDLDTYISRPFIDAAKNATNAYRKVRVSNEEDFFRDFELTYPNVPSQSVSYGNEWDLYCASMNETTAAMRRATEKLRSAEALASIVSLKNKKFINDLSQLRNRAWESFGVYWEHNWTADGPVSRKARADWQINVKERLVKYVDTLQMSSVKLLGDQIRKGLRPKFFVFNPLSWTRDDVADVLYTGSTPVKVIDLTNGEEVASQRINKAGKEYIRIAARNIPSIGYKVFEIRQDNNPSPLTTAVDVKGEYIRNQFYRIRLTPSGVITELYDSLAKSRQLVNRNDARYLNDLGTTDLKDGNKLVVENRGPVSVTIKAVSNNPVKHTVRVTLFSTSNRIDIEDSIQVNFDDVKTWTFSYDLKNQITRHEELGAILTVKKETRGGHYADNNARYDWQTFNHFADMSESDYGITLSNIDCSFFKLGQGTVDSLWEQSSQLHALAGGNIDKKREDKGILGILKQNGNSDFRYQFAIAIHQSGFDALQAMKFSLEHQNPLVTGMIAGTKEASDIKSYSLLSSSNPNVILWSVKPSEEGIDNGLITRFWNVGQVPALTRIKMPLPILKAWKISHIETNESALNPVKGELHFNIRSNQMSTYRIIPSY